MVIEGWEATAAVMASPEIVAEIIRSRNMDGYRPLADFIGP